MSIKADPARPADKQRSGARAAPGKDVSPVSASVDRKEQAARDAKKALADYAAAQKAIDERTAELRAARLAREEEERRQAAAAPKPVKGKARAKTSPGSAMAAAAKTRAAAAAKAPAAKAPAAKAKAKAKPRG